jgi:hypothetical protein
MAARRRRVGERGGTFEAIGLADLVYGLAPGTNQLPGDALELQVCLEFSRRVIALVDILRQIDFDQLKKPTIRLRKLW